MSTTTSTFQFPSIYNYKPFFTKQPNEQTWNAQLTNWSDLILQYCKHNQIYKLTAEHELFHNKSIDRRLKSDTIKLIFNYMITQGRAEQHTPDTILVYFKTPQEWATSISNWVKENGQSGAVLTLAELSEGDLVTRAEFYQIDPDVLKKAVDVLVQRSQAVLMKSDGKLAGIKVL